MYRDFVERTEKWLSEPLLNPVIVVGDNQPDLTGPSLLTLRPFLFLSALVCPCPCATLLPLQSDCTISLAYAVRYNLLSKTFASASIYPFFRVLTLVSSVQGTIVLSVLQEEVLDQRWTRPQPPPQKPNFRWRICR